MVKVLIVDDSQSVRQMILELLTKEAIKVIEAASGLEAKEKIQESERAICSRFLYIYSSLKKDQIWVAKNSRHQLQISVNQITYQRKKNNIITTLPDFGSILSLLHLLLW